MPQTSASATPSGAAPDAPVTAPVTAAVIVIGNEILSGRTRDANLPYLANRLNELGIRLAEARVVRDETAAIVAAVNELRLRCDYVFTSGGIGPTHDDITAAAVAEAFGTVLERNAEAVRRLEDHYEPGQLNAARLTMADLPVGAALIDNPVSAAPGFRLGNVYVLAGVPVILQAMFETLAGGLAGGAPMVSRTVSSYLTEGTVANAVAAVQRAHPEVEIGSYPFLRRGRLGTSLVVRGPDPGRVDAAAEALIAVVRTLGGEPLAEPVDPIGG